jgi:hypothetical protein
VFFPIWYRPAEQICPDAKELGQKSLDGFHMRLTMLLSGAPPATHDCKQDRHWRVHCSSQASYSVA